jgi:hypothetical protein
MSDDAPLLQAHAVSGNCRLDEFVKQRKLQDEPGERFFPSRSRRAVHERVLISARILSTILRSGRSDLNR